LAEKAPRKWLSSAVFEEKRYIQGKEENGLKKNKQERYRRVCGPKECQWMCMWPVSFGQELQEWKEQRKMASSTVQV